MSLKNKSVNGIMIVISLIACEETDILTDDPPLIELVTPTNLQLTIISSDSIGLSWIDNSIGETGFTIERKDTNDFRVIATIESNSTGFVDPDPVYCHINHYRVSAFTEDSISAAVYDSLALVFLSTEWSFIPAGDYRYGLNGDIRDDIDYDFEMMSYEVSNGQFAQFLNEAMKLGTLTVPGSLPVGYYEGDERWGAAQRVAVDVNDPDSRISWDGVSFIADSSSVNAPVSEVPWYGAYFFARHYGLKVPTEFEWEKAARGNLNIPYPWGEESPSCELANTAGCGADLINVGETQGASPYGVHDLIGNVWEWVDSFKSMDSPDRVLRGGSCNSTAHTTYVYSRNADDAWHTSYFYGFRCIREK